MTCNIFNSALEAVRSFHQPAFNRIHFFVRFTKDSPRFKDELEIMKYICKDFWTAVYKKQIDNLRTNHQVCIWLIDHITCLFYCFVAAKVKFSRHWILCLVGKKGCFPSTKNLGLKFWKFQVPNGTVYCGSTDPSQGTAHLVIALVSRIQKSSSWDNSFVKWNYRHSSSTDWNDQTGQSGPFSKVILIILVEQNGNGPFHLISNQNFQNFGLNKRCPKSAWIDEYAPLSIATCCTLR